MRDDVGIGQRMPQHAHPQGMPLPAHPQGRAVAGSPRLPGHAASAAPGLRERAHHATAPLQERQQARLALPRRRARMPERKPQDTPRPKVVVLIPAHNEAASIVRTITSLRMQMHRPDEITVVCDNCTDDTAELALLHGAKVIETVRNTSKKAGALNQGLHRILPELSEDDLVLTIDADSRLNRNWIRDAVRTLSRSPGAGAVCGTVFGEAGHGLIGQFQQNEYVRGARTISRLRYVRVLSGCGTVFRAGALRQVAALRGRTVPGRTGECFSTPSMTEDYEMTLALKTLGFACLFSECSVAVTELMPTWPDLFRQRVRWQRGQLGDLVRYGFRRATWTDWLRQAFGYVSYVVMVLCWTIITWSLIQHGQFSLRWGLSVLILGVIERVWTSRRAGYRGMLLALGIIPELAYGMFELSYLVWAAFAEFTQRRTSWHHIGPEAA